MLEQSYNRVITRQRYLEQSSYRSRFAFESAKLLSVTRQTKCRPFIVCKHSIDTIVFDDRLSLSLSLSLSLFTLVKTSAWQQPGVRSSLSLFSDRRLHCPTMGADSGELQETKCVLATRTLHCQFLPGRTALSVGRTIKY